MILAPFELHRPATLADALALAERYGEEADFIAGGTDLLQNYKNRLHVREHLISLDAVEEMRGIAATRIGATERLSDVSASAVAREHWPGLAEAITHVASPLIRNQGTIGGNLLVETRCYYYNQSPFWRSTKGSCMKAESDECLVIPQKETCYAAYSGDLAPLMGCLDATLRLESPVGGRDVKVTDFYEGDGIQKNVLEKGELITAIQVPKESASLRAGYRKLRLRDALDYPEAGVAASLRLESDGRTVRQLRAATTAVDVVPHFADFTDTCAGRDVADVIEEVAEEMHRRAAPKKNTALPVGYRKNMVRVFLRRLIEDLAEGRDEGRIPSA